jgi:hypothetical protein
MATLVFIDTNIFLDFYRLGSREAGLTILDKLDQHKDAIITGDQVNMEFKKNRQKVILGVYGAMKAPDFGSLQLPPVVAQSKASRSLERHKKGIRNQAERLKKRLQSVIEDPSRYDPVYRTVQRLFRHRGSYNLSREKDVRLEIRKLAEKRFLLGYPPRKLSDNSIGDAINWEWIVRCAKDSGHGVVIVTRDSDYGATIEGKPALNDWLREEFRARVARRRKILLTDRLSVGLKEAAIPLTKQEADAEDALIDVPKAASHETIQRRLLEIIGYKQVVMDAVLVKEESPREDA